MQTYSTHNTQTHAHLTLLLLLAACPSKIMVGRRKFRLGFCEHKNCNDDAHYLFPDDAIGRLCKLHRLAGMIKIDPSQTSKRGRLCSFRGERCTTQPKYNYPNEECGLMCYKHKDTGMVNVMIRKEMPDYVCEAEGCTKRKTYNFLGSPKPKFCGEHKEEGMVCLKEGICEQENCTKYPHYNYEGELNVKYCGEHKLEGMVNLRAPRCQHRDDPTPAGGGGAACSRTPCYGLPGPGARATHCARHKVEGMEPLRGPRCAAQVGAGDRRRRCPRKPRYQYAGAASRGRRYCALHKFVGMVLIESLSKRYFPCRHPNCHKTAYFNFPQVQERAFCGDHRLEGMVDIGHRPYLCRYAGPGGCSKNPNYGYAEEGKRLMCKEHKLEGMVNVKGPKCSHGDCLKFPFFNFRGAKQGAFCSKHKEEGMVDVKNARCVVEDCERVVLQPKSGSRWKGGIFKGAYCRTHTAALLKCAYPRCQSRATWNFHRDKHGKYCTDHRLEGMKEFPVCLMQPEGWYFQRPVIGPATQSSSLLADKRSKLNFDEQQQYDHPVSKKRLRRPHKKKSIMTKKHVDEKDLGRKSLLLQPHANLTHQLNPFLRDGGGSNETPSAFSYQLPQPQQPIPTPFVRSGAGLTSHDDDDDDDPTNAMDYYRV